MNEGHDEQQDTSFSVNSKLNLDPAQAGKKLKQQQYKIDDSQNKHNRNAANDHSKTSYSFILVSVHPRIYFGRDGVSNS